MATPGFRRRISFDDYSSKVIAYLDPEQAELFASQDAQHLMQQIVVDRLTELARDLRVRPTRRFAGSACL